MVGDAGQAVPTLFVGAGVCDGQLSVWHYMRRRWVQSFFWHDARASIYGVGDDARAGNHRTRANSILRDQWVHWAA